MKSSSPHISFESLADLATGRLSPSEMDASMTHISVCSACKGELQKLEEVIGLMRSDNAEDAPRDVQSAAINIFRQRSQSPERSLLHRLIATLTFDSQTAVPAFGFRSGQSESRQLLYSAEGNDIDLRITVQNDQCLLAGQVLMSDCVGGRVELEGPAGYGAADLNELCEFTLPAVPPGNYQLRLRMADVEVEIPRLEL